MCIRSLGGVGGSMILEVLNRVTLYFGALVGTSIYLRVHFINFLEIALQVCRLRQMILCMIDLNELVSKCDDAF